MGRKPVVYGLQESDDEGLMALFCSTNEIAQKAMLEHLKDNLDNRTINLDGVRTEIAYEHKKCGFYTLGENICLECGETLNGKGRNVHVYYFK